MGPGNGPGMGVGVTGPGIGVTGDGSGVGRTTPPYRIVKFIIPPIPSVWVDEGEIPRN
jgi:hypothetical protein